MTRKSLRCKANVLLLNSSTSLLNWLKGKSRFEQALMFTASQRRGSIRAFLGQARSGMYDTICCIRGISTPELLIASHIVPWSANKRHRIDPENGLCLNALHDRAFDVGLITITPEYKAKLSKRLLNESSNLIAPNYFLAYHGRPITLPERHHPNVDFLQNHNDVIFLG